MNTDKIPGGRGYYALIMKVSSRLVVRTRGGRVFNLDPGIYVYLGSAKGPGGIRARVARHLRRNKKAHWHIDYLTSHPSVEIHAVLSFTGEEADMESLLAQRLIDKLKPIPGFGSTDKRNDPTHLYYCGGPDSPVEECIETIYREAFLIMSEHEHRHTYKLHL